MWIAFRLIVALVGFVLRQRYRASKPAGGESVEGRLQFVGLNRNKKNELTGFTIGVALEAPIVFRLHLETASDRLFKKIGLATEIETGDATFDRRNAASSARSGSPSRRWSAVATRSLRTPSSGARS